MPAFNEKVKDLIEVRKFNSVRDFHSDPAATLDAYRFTDITAGLLASWLDSVSRASGNEPRRRALAGYRGVGKSHFLGVFAAVIANPELRSKLTDQHVALSANGLLRRRYPVAHVLRGTRDSLLDELRAASAECFDLSINKVPANLEELLELVSEQAGDMPFVILIDTAHDRTSRVKRDDGEFLGKLSAAALEHNMFIGVALDDDITEADGTNAAIVQNYSIDYLDQEHLYRIVDAHIFPKNRARYDAVADAYSFFRKVIPDFRWSQERFTSLYPLHPLILEIAPVVRLYAPDFALLSFASDAGNRILGRPARSLIGLDEVFDCVESTLRTENSLEDAFRVYDRVSSEISSLVPVFQRLQAKLILKALFILSLEGEGATAGELSAAILIYEEDDPTAAAEKVAGLVELFTDAFPNEFWRIENPEEIRFSLKVSGKDNLNHALAAAILKVGDEVVPSVLRRTGKDRYPDWPLSSENDPHTPDFADVTTVWRGSLRRVRVFWNWRNDEFGSLKMLGEETSVDLHLVIGGPGGSAESEGSIGPVFWTPAPPTPSEEETLKRYSVLLNDESIKQEFSEQLGPAGHTHTVAVEKIWKRLFLKDSKILAGGKELDLPAGSADEVSLSGLLSTALAPVFDEAYPEHPEFAEPLGMKEVSSLVSDLFSGVRVAHQHVQHLAKTFAEPLGLVAVRGENLVLEREERLFGLHLVEKVLSLVGQEGEETVPLQAVYKRLRERPYGLAREAQHLILAALVAQGKIEFFTKKGDRINRRSLDLKIIWDDIAGISKPADVIYGSRRLTEWVILLTGSGSIENIDIAEDRKYAKAALLKWAEDWDSERILERFNALHSDQLNTGVWGVAINAEKSFGAVRDSLGGIFDESLSLEEALQRIADAFNDSESEFELRSADLVTVVNFVEGAGLRERVSDYLSLCEYTSSESVEDLRRRLYDVLKMSETSPGEDVNGDLEVTFEEFRRTFANYFSEAHGRAMNSHDIQEKLTGILESEEWWEFINLSRLPIFRSGIGGNAKALVDKLRNLNCRLEIEEAIYEKPYCTCSFRLRNADQWHRIPKELIEIVMQGSESFKRTLRTAADVLDPILAGIESATSDGSVRSAASGARSKLRSGGVGPMFTTDELQQLRRACGMIENSQVVNAQLPHFGDFVTAEELSNRFESWISELPGEPLFLSL